MMVLKLAKGLRAALDNTNRQSEPESNSTVAEANESVLNSIRWIFSGAGDRGFGGPIALAVVCSRTLSIVGAGSAKKIYLEGLALAQLAPCPLAAQLAIYILVTSAPAVLGATASVWRSLYASFLMVLALSAAYVRFGGLPGCRNVLWHRRGRDRHHRPVGVQADQTRPQQR